MAEYEPHDGSLDIYALPDILCVCAGESGSLDPVPSLDVAATGDGDSELGVDIDVLTDLPPGFTLATGVKNLANALLRRLSTPERFLADAFGDDPDYGWDCRRLLNRALSDEAIRGELAQAERQATQDDRVQTATARYEISGALPEQTVTLELDVTTAEGPFRLVVAIDAVPPTLLSVDPIS